MSGGGDLRFPIPEAPLSYILPGCPRMRYGYSLALPLLRVHIITMLPTPPPSLMVNFMCQLSWATVFRYLVKHYSGCFCADVFG